MKIVNWNVEWAQPKNRRYMPERIKEHADAEIICITEADKDLFSGDLFRSGDLIYSQTGFNCRKKAGNRRKVFLWSKQPWQTQSIDYKESNPLLPPGRFVSAITQTSLGDVMVVGVCIPWSRSRNYDHCGNQKKEAWEDHKDFLAQLGGIIQHKLDQCKNLVLVGDFNQRLGNHIQYNEGSQPQKRRQMLDNALKFLNPITAGFQFETKKQAKIREVKSHDTIDHIALSVSLKESEPIIAIDNIKDRVDPPDQWQLLSDHFGIVAMISQEEGACTLACICDGERCGLCAGEMKAGGLISNI